MAVVLQTEGQADQPQACRFESRPNCSLHGTSRKLAFWLIASVCMGVASGFCLVGYWPVMPFAGLEIGVLAWAFDVIRRRESDYERLEIDQDRVMLVTRREGKIESRDLNRYWTKVIVQCDRPGADCHVLIRSAGKDSEVGCHLSDRERLELAQLLKKQLAI
ncbi:MAG: DUF2244 domain-containing protein [Thiobacillaceae bacterium]